MGIVGRLHHRAMVVVGYVVCQSAWWCARGGQGWCLPLRRWRLDLTPHDADRGLPGLQAGATALAVT